VVAPNKMLELHFRAFGDSRLTIRRDGFAVLELS
jgi:hypothetical protein